MSESLEINNVGRTRVTRDLSKRLTDILEALAKEKDTTKADVLRAAIEYLAMANDAAQDGMQVGAWKDEKDVRRERVFAGLS